MCWWKVDQVHFKYFEHEIDYVNFPAFSIRINSKRNFDEIGHGNDWGRFVRKRNFDEIDGGRFDSRFVKKVNISIVVPYIFLPFKTRDKNSLHSMFFKFCRRWTRSMVMDSEDSQETLMKLTGQDLGEDLFEEYNVQLYCNNVFFQNNC